MTLVGFTALSVEISTIASAPTAARRIGDVARAGGVGQQALQRVGLDHRHVLQRRGVEHQLRPPCVEHVADPRLVADVGDQRLRAARADGVSASSRSICHSAYSPLSSSTSRSGPKRRHLPRQLAADRAAGAGHHDPPPLDQPRHALAVERHLRPVQQVLDRHRPEFERARAHRCAAGPSAVSRGARRSACRALGLVDQPSPAPRPADRALPSPACRAAAVAAQRSSTAAASPIAPRIGHP